MRKILMPIVLCFITCNILSAKGTQVSGYIIENSGERIEGEVIVGSITDNETKVKFIFENGDRKTFKPEDLLGYGFKDLTEDDFGLEESTWKHFEKHTVDYPPKPFGSNTVFLEREVDGEITLYCYYVEVRSNVNEPYRYYYYIKEADGVIKKINKDDYLVLAKRLFKNYTALYSRLGKRDFAYRNLSRMVNDYNYWLSNQHEKTEYRVALKE